MRPQDAFALRPLPAFDNSAMDGYALQADSCRAGVKFRVVGEQPAGADRGLAIGAGEAIRIFTGAPLPAGANAVIMQEDVTREGETIVLQGSAEPGEFIRRQGSDLAAGQKILSRGERIAAQTVALLASQGIAEFEVGGAPRIAIVSTGDELAQLGETPRPGQIFESNSIMLRALALAAGAEVTRIEHCADHLETMTEVFRHGLQGDAFIISGGVSVGDHDFVKPALRALGAEIDLWRVALKPGKPFLFGRAGRCCIFGLPGNPVSAFVTFLKFVRPALLKMEGAAEEFLGLRKVTARLARRGDEFRRSAALSAGAAARGSVRSKRTAGVARAFRPESRECSPSRGGRRQIHCRPKRDSGIVGLVGSSLGDAPAPKISPARPARSRWRFRYFGGSLNRDGSDRI